MHPFINHSLPNQKFCLDQTVNNHSNFEKRVFQMPFCAILWVRFHYECLIYETSCLKEKIETRRWLSRWLMPTKNIGEASHFSSVFNIISSAAFYINFYSIVWRMLKKLKPCTIFSWGPGVNLFRRSSPPSTDWTLGLFKKTLLSRINWRGWSAHSGHQDELLAKNLDP